MAANLLSLRLVSALLLAVAAEPVPARIPKVYNALITSNQNLEPSKSYPVYQPVLHDPFGFSVHPSVLYGGEFPFGNGIAPQPVPPRGAEAPADQSPAQPLPPLPSSESPETPPPEPPAKEPLPPAEPPSAAPDAETSTAPLPPPNTESPIPLNEFGLPSQVLPLGRINPAYHGFTQLGPYAYSYPGVRLYDPYDPFNLSPYSFPFYRPLPNVLGPSIGGTNLLGPSLIPYGGPSVNLVPAQAPAPAPAASPVDPSDSAQTPPPEPSDLNVLNYSSKDPAIPNVPPPPLPQGGLKSDKSE